VRTHGWAPAPSTVTEILRRNGVELGALGGGARPFIRFEKEAPNELWQMDFKGHVAMRAGARLHPLTVLDDHSRFCIVLAPCLDQRTQTVKTHLRRAFCEHGLPIAIISDNGSPWGDRAGSPFTPLGVWLLEHDVRIAHARPYHPQTMGKDERFHRTLDLEVLAQQTFNAVSEAAHAFAHWRGVYNRERPHEAIANAVPADRYRKSERAYRDRVEPFAYRDDDILVRVGEGGRIGAFGKHFRVPKAFRDKRVAIRAADQDGLYAVFFRGAEIARLDRRTGKRHPPNLSTMSPNGRP
jgi:transposase InsO family protein